MILFNLEKSLMFIFLSFAVGWNHWNDHVLGWWNHKDDPNVLFLKYEDLKKVCYSCNGMLGLFNIGIM